MIHWRMIIKKCHIRKKKKKKKTTLQLWFHKKKTDPNYQGNSPIHPSIHPSIGHSLLTLLQSKELDRSHLSAGFCLFIPVGCFVFFGEWKSYPVFLEGLFLGVFKGWRSYPSFFWGNGNDGNPTPVFCWGEDCFFYKPKKKDPDF